jgi:hypothetical protein
MKRIAAIAVAVALVVPGLAFAQASGAWCGGSYGVEGTNFGPCVAVESGAQVAGQASGIQGQSGATEPQYPATGVTFEDGKAFYNKQELRLNWAAFPDRTHEFQSDGDSGGD